ncbi:uncharacterized protein LY89DRAFT_274893 [Mollisia scopiformis]|uniref:Chitin-binding type-1 domain-containing protein n=1 Tax=Mollisia scopiformis TaxID=149040 RepID=A0A132BB41_MOLSC|nr:uncharacterized protein LY89DRAFT_274893 [Mollisia scopiformis]KUJ09640.1 hypothetical protein LY89DRAFT_274893 [Mollisia scopiformis]
MSFTMKYTMLFFILAMVSPLAQAYQTMRIPNPLRYTFNAYLNDNTTRDNYTVALTADQFPCKGYMSDMYTDPNGNGWPVTPYEAGEAAWIILTGESLGGSGQISMSGNNGSLTVIHTFEGNVGTSNQQQLDFTVPVDAPTGTAVLAFSYFPLGSNEVCVSCAAITIKPAQENATLPTTPFASRPDIFVSDMNNSCTRDPTKEVMFPNPGPDYTMNHTVPMASEVNTIFGTCLPVNGYGNGAKDNATQSLDSVPFPIPTSSTHSAGSSTGYLVVHHPNGHNSTHGRNSTRPTHTARPIANSTSTITIHTHTPGTAPRSNPSGTSNPFASLPISQDGQCGKESRCPAGLCCSMFGNCGTGVNYCGSFTCKVGFGACSKFDNGTVPVAEVKRGVAGRVRW